MPELSCLFAPAAEAALAALRGDPACGDRLHRFTACPGIQFSAGDALAVVRLGGAVAPPWADADGTGDARSNWENLDAAGRRLIAPALQRHVWLERALPPADVLAGWAALSRTSGLRLAWWWWWERGDDLYADAAWLFGPDRQVLAARATYLAEDVERERGFVYTDDGAPPSPLTGAPFRMAMAHLGFGATLQYFAPMEDWHFDWTPQQI